MFRGSEKVLKEDSLWNVLLDQFNECEETRSLGNIFIFRESEKGLKKTPWGLQLMYETASGRARC
jgi:hypothetical protein